MILFLNTYIVPTKAFSTCIWDRGNLSEPCKVDTFKYSISSLSKSYPWSKVIIYFSLHEEYASRQEEIVDHIKNEFESVKDDIDVVIRNERNEYQSQWRETYDLFDDDLIFYCGNHDHIFMGSEHLFGLAVEEFRSQLAVNEGLASLRFSHFPELFRAGIFQHCQDQSGTTPLKNIHQTVVCNSDAIQVLSKDLYHKWFWHTDFGDRPIGRTDGPDTHLSNSWNPSFGWTVYSMNHEHIRHFDGYNHVGIPNSSCAVLDIPKGYFDNNIIVRVGYEEHIEGTFKIDPFQEKSHAEDLNGTDFPYYLEDLPSHIYKRISDIDINPQFSYSKDEINKQLYHRRLEFLGRACLSPYELEDSLLGKSGIIKHNLQDYIDYNNVRSHGESGVDIIDSYAQVYYKKYGIESINND